MVRETPTLLADLASRCAWRVLTFSCLFSVWNVGRISSITVMGQTLVILNDRRLAVELMEKRSAIHSSRAMPVFVGELYASFLNCTPMPYALIPSREQGGMGECNDIPALCESIPCPS
jgi:hypothetical protein